MYGFSSTKELNVLFKVREQYAFYDQISALFKVNNDSFLSDTFKSKSLLIACCCVCTLHVIVT